MSQNISVSPHILDVTEYYLPIDLSQVFGNNQDSALEIGFGDGSFLIETARNNTDWNFIGIEIKEKRFKKAVKKAEVENIANLKLLLMDVKIATDEVFCPNTFSKVYINFPDPWPKERHKKHRIINTHFLEKLSRIMKPKGVLEIASDHEEYISYILETLDGTGIFKPLFPSPGYVHSVSNRPKTRYEMEFMKEGKEICYLRFIKDK
ncbi:MAG TPA: tRNA (guanosine(46)-N7)-methyltransferase TrmB [Thermodesulfobacteriota bacterium]|nr:tRNA (guanosine(46)-N7)-methyltransferase TrmB [Thermodesulfobacteriota bacterium]HZX14465.1 tRNA (guanosine(46)-N7)-methyltransferase TrmB [Thermodesulfobacteriota bacterium]